MGRKYKTAGVDIEKLRKVKKEIKKYIKQTFFKKPLCPGLFASGIEIKGFKNPVIVATTDGVGTKLLVAKRMGVYDTIGKDLVNHSINDIISIGADPLFFQDYISFSDIEEWIIKDIIKGIRDACKKEKVVLGGGETAQLPGIYKKGDFELAGTMIGIVEKERIIDGTKIRKGDAVIGLLSNGLHTNGYSLARKILFKEKKLKPITYIPELKCTLGEELLKVHRSYRKEIKAVLSQLNGIAHITGGGFYENIKRVLPSHLDCVIEVKWEIPFIFKLIQEYGKVDRKEMFEVFNMGIGMVLFVSQDKKEKVLKKIKGVEIGYVKTGKHRVIIQ